MNSFAVTPLAASSWAFGLWPSTSQKTARNPLGTFYLVGVLSRDPVNYTSTDFTLSWDRGAGPVPIWTATLPTNMASVEAFESGEVHVVACNFTSGQLLDFCWPNMASSTTPTATTISGFGMSGKIGTAVDDVNRCIHAIGGVANVYAKVNAAGALIAQQTIFAPTTETTHYQSLCLDGDNALYVAVCNADAGASTDYGSVTAFMTPDPADTAPSWYAGLWRRDPTLTVPFDPGIAGPATPLTYPFQQRRNNNLLCGAAVSGGTMLALISEISAAGEAFYAYDDFRDMTLGSIEYQWGAPTTAQVINRPVHGATLFPKCCSGAPAYRAPGAFIVAHDRTNLIALKKDASGKWQDYASTSLLPYLGPTSNWTPRDLGICRGSDKDSDIIGQLTIMQTDPATWATSPPGFNPACSTLRFSLALS